MSREAATPSGRTLQIDTAAAIAQELGARDVRIIELNAALQALGKELAEKDARIEELTDELASRLEPPPPTKGDAMVAAGNG